MAVRTSNGTGGGDFLTGSTWVGGVVPNGSDTFVVAAGDNVFYDLSAGAFYFAGKVHGTFILIDVSSSYAEVGSDVVIEVESGGVLKCESLWQTGEAKVIVKNGGILVIQYGYAGFRLDVQSGGLCLVGQDVDATEYPFSELNGSMIVRGGGRVEVHHAGVTRYGAIYIESGGEVEYFDSPYVGPAFSTSQGFVVDNGGTLTIHNPASTSSIAVSYRPGAIFTGVPSRFLLPLEKHAIVTADDPADEDSITGTNGEGTWYHPNSPSVAPLSSIELGIPNINGLGTLEITSPSGDDMQEPFDYTTATIGGGETTVLDIAPSKLPRVCVARLTADAGNAAPARFQIKGRKTPGGTFSPMDLNVGGDAVTLQPGESCEVEVLFKGVIQALRVVATGTNGDEVGAEAIC